MERQVLCGPREDNQTHPIKPVNNISNHNNLHYLQITGMTAWHDIIVIRTTHDSEKQPYTRYRKINIYIALFSPDELLHLFGVGFPTSDAQATGTPLHERMGLPCGTQVGEKADICISNEVARGFFFSQLVARLKPTTLWLRACDYEHFPTMLQTLVNFQKTYM